MKKHLIIIAALLVALPTHASACNGMGLKAGPCPVTAMHGAAHGKHGHHAIPGQSYDYIRHILKSADRIGLNEKQRKQIGELLIRAESEAAKAHAEAEVTVAGFRSQLHSGSVTDKQVSAYTKRMGELRAERLAANLKATVAASRLLTAEQKQKLHPGKTGMRSDSK